MSKHKICGLTLPEYVETFIREKAEKEHRSISNVVALIVINYVNKEGRTKNENNCICKKGKD